MKPTANTLTFDEYLTESRTLDLTRKWLRKSVKEVGSATNKRLTTLLHRVISSLFERSEAERLSKSIHQHSVDLVTSFEKLKNVAKSIDLDSKSALKQSTQLKLLAIETRQKANQFLNTLEAYRRSSIKGGKLVKNSRIDMRLFNDAFKQLQSVEELCDCASKASALIVTNNIDTARKQLQIIINTNF